MRLKILAAVAILVAILLAVLVLPTPISKSQDWLGCIPMLPIPEGVWSPPTQKIVPQEPITVKPVPTVTKPPPTPTNNPLPNSIISLVNHQRALERVHPLFQDIALTKLAQVRAEEMAKFGVLTHDMPVTGTPYEATQAVHLKYTNVGENIGYYSKQDDNAMVNAWMNSEGHRENILREDFSKTGVGVAKTDNKVWYVQMFIG